MDWFDYIRQNIWVGIMVASVLTSLVVAFVNLSQTGQKMENTHLNIGFAVLFGVAVTNFNLDWNLFTTYQDTFIRLSLTILIPYLVAKVSGQEIVDNIVRKVVDGAKGLTIGNKPPTV